MQINSINQSQGYKPDFKATIRVNKANLVNLTKDLGDSASMSASSTALIPSAVSEATIFPMEKGGIGFKSTMKKIWSIISEKFNKILGRPIKPVRIEGDTTAIKQASKIAGAETTGSGILSTGVGSYTSAGASIMDQSVHYPVSGSDMLPANWLAWMRENPLQDAAYNILYNERGFGNESASVIASFASAPGAMSHVGGSEIIAAPRKFLKGGLDALGKSSKDIPS